MAAWRMRGLGFAEVIERRSLTKDVPTAKQPGWIFQEDVNKAQFMWRGQRQWGWSVLAGRVTGCRCPVIGSARCRLSPLHQQESHLSGSVRTRPTGVIKSHSKALKASCLSPSQSVLSGLSMGIAFPWPTRSQAPPKYLTYVKTFYYCNTPSRNAKISIFYWWLSWAQRGEVISHDHIISI